MTNLDTAALDEIAARAEAATPGPWTLGWEDDHGWVAFVSEVGAREGVERHVISSRHADEERADADAAHIAGMDPATTLALVAEVRRLRDDVARVRALCALVINDPYRCGLVPAVDANAILAALDSPATPERNEP